MQLFSFRRFLPAGTGLILPVMRQKRNICFRSMRMRENRVFRIFPHEGGGSAWDA
jgi:hypothetical protein